MTYPRCSFKSVIDLVLSFAGQQSDQISPQQTQQIGGFINQRLRDWAWIAWPWPQLTPTELRRYRSPYSDITTYAAPTATTASEVYFPPTQKYYQALRVSTSNPPAQLVNGVYVTNGEYWALASGPYTGPDWQDATDYIAGNIRRNPDDNRFYQCYLDHTSSGSLDTSKFGLLTIFDPYISKTQSWEDNEMGEIFGLYLDNPLLVTRPRRIEFVLDFLGAHIRATPHSRYGRGLGCDFIVPNQVYARFRIPCPDFKGQAFDVDATYSADEDTVYFEGTTTDLEGDCWSCVTDTSAGESPESAPLKWKRLDFPIWLRTAVARRALADWLRYGANREAAFSEDAAGDDALFQSQLQAGSQQGQVLRWRQA